MESQLQRTHDHHRFEQDPHHYTGTGLQSVMEGEGEAEHNHHGEKKSVLTKVKNKAKKIKDKIKHAGHAHEDDDDDYDEDEETVNVSDVHGAPVVNESGFISGTALPKQTGLNLENPTNPLEDRQSRIARDDDVGNVVGATTASDRHMRNEMYQSIGNDAVIETSPLMEDPYIPTTTRKEEYSVGEKMADISNPSLASIHSPQQANVIGPLLGLEEDPHFPKTHPLSPPNYQTKVADPTGQGGAEVDVAPLVQRLDNLHVDDQSEERGYTGSHDQFAPQPTPTSGQSFDNAESLPRDTAATSVIANRASSAKDVVASKLGYGGSGESQQPSEKGAVSEYAQKMAETLAPVYEKAAGAGSAIMSKVQRGGGDVVGKESDKGVSVQEYLVEKLSPGEEDRELSKVITGAIRGQEQQQQQPVKEKVRVEAVVSDEKVAAGVVDRVKGAIGSWLGKNSSGQQGQGEGLEKGIASRLQE